MQKLHWLPVRQRLKFKTAVLMFKCLHGLAPVYLSYYCKSTTDKTGRSHLRSANTGLLSVPRTRTTYGDRSFAVANQYVEQFTCGYEIKLVTLQRTLSEDISRHFSLAVLTISYMCIVEMLACCYFCRHSALVAPGDIALNKFA